MAWGKHLPPAPELKLLQVSGAGYEQVDFAAVPPAASICNAFGHEEAMGEYAVMAMLAWCHRFLTYNTAFRRGSWRLGSRFNGPFHDEFNGKTVGILGLGRIGQAVARRAKALDTKVIAINRTARPAPATVDRLYPWGELAAFLKESDFVVVCCALNEETKGLLEEKAIALLGPDAVVMNLARGPIIDEDALYAALKERRIGGAILDVWWRYPPLDDPEAPPSRHEFRKLSNVLMTPHVSGWTHGMLDRRMAQVAENVARLSQGRPLLNVIRPGARGAINGL
ncbi:MAG: NAD(P)-binding domain-containing protein [Proteobacteria bacterium]|nr:NAD(P)-binding domain-containing protein [Pseudomonadota bacterium]MBI3498688.1 NAD(P)-binding domain-containing protein [Pseudomonadota bacterium]